MRQQQRVSEKLYFYVQISEDGQLFEPVLANNATPRRILHGALKTTRSTLYVN